MKDLMNMEYMLAAYAISGCFCDDTCDMDIRDYMLRNCYV